MSPHSESPRSGGSKTARGALAILVVALSAWAYYTRDCFVDDAFIGFQYIENLLAGHGLTFHPGDEPVEGVSNIGWLLLLAPISTVVKPTVAAKCLGLTLLLASLAATMMLGTNLTMREERMASLAIAKPQAAERSACWGGSSTATPTYQLYGFGLTLVPMILLASSFEFIYFSLAGMETSLLAGVLLLMACVAMRSPCSTSLPLLGAFAFLVHPEAAAVYPLFAALSWIRGPVDRRRLIVGGIVFLVAVGAMTAARFAYFGDFVPNTFHSKPSGLRLAVENSYGLLMGHNTNVAFPITGWLAIPLLVLGYWRLRRSSAGAADMLAATCGVGLMFAVYSPPDWTSLPRYFAPYLPAALILLWSGLTETAKGVWLVVEHASPQAVCQEGAASARGVRSVLFVVALLLVVTAVFNTRNKMSQLETFPGYVMAGRNLVGPAEWMCEHLPADATIATRRIGALAYYSHRNVFDYTYGLPDPEVARLVGRRGERFDMPTDPDLADVWRARAPAYFLEDAVTLNYILSQTGGVRERFSIHGAEYRVVREFPIGCDAKWVLARCQTPGGGDSPRRSSTVSPHNRRH
jgi:hypothetical protein